MLMTRQVMVYARSWSQWARSKGFTGRQEWPVTSTTRQARAQHDVDAEEAEEIPLPQETRLEVRVTGQDEDEDDQDDDGHVIERDQIVEIRNGLTQTTAV